MNGVRPVAFVNNGKVMGDISTDEDLFQENIKEFLLYHKIVEAIKTGDQTAMVKLDNGVILHFYGNKGCRGCGEGYFSIDKFIEKLPDNAITDVKFKVTSNEEYFTIHIFYEEEELNLISYEGHDNGYYGTGFTVKVETQPPLNPRSLPFMEKLGGRVKTLVADRNISDEQVADLLDASKEEINSFFQGEQFISYKQVEQLASLLKIPVKELIP